MLILGNNNMLMAKARLSEEEIQLRKKVGPKLKAILKDKNIKGVQLAAGLGCTGAWLSQVMKGNRGLSILWLMKVAKYLNISPAELLPEIEALLTPQSTDEAIKKMIDEAIEKKAKEIFGKNKNNRGKK